MPSTTPRINRRSVQIRPGTLADILADADAAAESDALNIATLKLRTAAALQAATLPMSARARRQSRQAVALRNLLDTDRKSASLVQKFQCISGQCNTVGPQVPIIAGWA